MITRLFVPALVLGASLGAQQPRQASAGIPSVTIVGSDYAFLQTPSSLPAGETLFRFENRGKVQHEMVLVSLKPGVTPQQYMRAASQHMDSAWARTDKLIGILITDPGQTTVGRILVDLEPGRDYAFVCQFQDKPGDRSHNAMGMFATFRANPR